MAHVETYSMCALQGGFMSITKALQLNGLPLTPSNWLENSY